MDCICVTAFDVLQARCFKLVRFSCICLAVCCFVFAFGVVSFFDLPIVSLLVLIAAEQQSERDSTGETDRTIKGFPSYPEWILIPIAEASAITASLEGCFAPSPVQGA